MKKVGTPTYDVGIIIARFQVHELHEGHIDLIKNVCAEHEKVIIFLGLSPCMVTQNNPLDFESRKQMILEKFPNVNVLYIKDQADDKNWSKELDEKIGDLVGPNQTAVLYGSRDSFIKYYSGSYATQELIQDVFISGSEIRKSISKKVKNTPEFRAGVIWAAYNQYPKVFPTVDVAIFNSDGNKVLLGRKPKETLFRFIGGFASTKDSSYEEDAIREVEEETGIVINYPEYIGSYLIDDWRYRNEKDKIKTLFFVATHVTGTPNASDDIAEVKWFDIKDLKEEDVVNTHKVLVRALNWYLESTDKCFISNFGINKNNTNKGEKV